MNPDCGGADKRCLIADARGEQYRCTSGCGYDSTFRPSLANIAVCDCNCSPHRRGCATQIKRKLAPADSGLPKA